MPNSAGFSLSGNVPQWLYESLPFIYIGGGVLTIFQTQQWLGLGSGALLMITGGHVFWLCRRIRSLPKVARGDSETALLGMAWLRAFEIDHPEVDDEHRKLFEESHVLLEALVSGTRAQIEEHIRVLAAAIRAHFSNENEILALENSIRAKAHIREHRRLQERLDKMVAGLGKGTVKRGQLVQFLLYDVIRMHMLASDTDIGLTGRRTAAAATAG